MESTPQLPPFLDPREIARSCAEADLGDTVTQTLLDFSQRIAADSDPSRIARRPSGPSHAPSDVT